MQGRCGFGGCGRVRGGLGRPRLLSACRVVDVVVSLGERAADC